MPTEIVCFRKTCERLGLAPWPRYETDPSFRNWINSSECAPDYSFAWVLSHPPFTSVDEVAAAAAY